MIFTCIKKYDFVPSFKALNDLYTPIIGNKAINIYISLYNESLKTEATRIKFNNIEKLLKANELTLEQFFQITQKLEALKLLKTYTDSDQSNKYYFTLITPLTFEDFILNKKFHHLLLSSIGQTSYKEIEYVYRLENQQLPSTAINVSKTFDQVFSSDELKKIYRFNFDELYANLSLKTHLIILLSDVVKERIEYYYLTYNFTISQFEIFINKAIFKSETTKQYEVDSTIFNNNIKSYIDTHVNTNLLKYTKINRNIKMFYETVSPEEINKVFDSYESFNPEHYLSLIKKTALTDDEKTTVQKLRIGYKLSNPLINMIIDFSFFKTLGNFTSKYMFKVAQTINNLNLLTLRELHNHLIGNKIYFTGSNFVKNTINNNQTSNLSVEEAQTILGKLK